MSKIIPLEHTTLRELFERDHNTLSLNMLEMKAKLKINCPYDLDKSTIHEFFPYHDGDYDREKMGLPPRDKRDTFVIFTPYYLDESLNK